jgi:hypothetical protein
MVQRVAGLFLVSQHPPEGTLTGRAFYQTVVGACVLGFPEGDELWAVARIIDEGAASSFAPALSSVIIPLTGSFGCFHRQLLMQRAYSD